MYIFELDLSNLKIVCISNSHQFRSEGGIKKSASYGNSSKLSRGKISISSNFQIEKSHPFFKISTNFVCPNSVQQYKHLQTSSSLSWFSTLISVFQMWHLIGLNCHLLTKHTITILPSSVHPQLSWTELALLLLFPPGKV